MRILISSGIARAGCVSFSWMATFSENLSKLVLTCSVVPNLELLYRLMISWRVAAHKKYSCFSRSSFPSKKLSLGYRTRVMFSARLRSRDSLDIISGIEELEVEVVGRLGRPQSHGVDHVVSVSWDRGVIRHGIDQLGVDPFINSMILDNTAVKMDRKLVLGPSFFPGIPESEPLIGFLDLFSVRDTLCEYSILVSNTITVSRYAQSGHRVQETGSQATQSAVPQAGIFFHFLQLFDVQPQLVNGLVTFRLEFPSWSWCWLEISRCNTQAISSRLSSDPFHNSAAGSWSTGRPDDPEQYWPERDSNRDSWPHSCLWLECSEDDDWRVSSSRWHGPLPRSPWPRSVYAFRHPTSPLLVDFGLQLYHCSNKNQSVSWSNDKKPRTGLRDLYCKELWGVILLCPSGKTGTQQLNRSSSWWRWYKTEGQNPLTLVAQLTQDDEMARIWRRIVREWKDPDRLWWFWSDGSVLIEQTT